METKTVFAAVGAMLLTVTGGVSALMLTMNNVEAAPDDAPAVEIVEYVDQFGNPVAAPAPAEGSELTRDHAESSPDAGAEPPYGHDDEEGEEHDDHEYDDVEEHDDHEYGDEEEHDDYEDDDEYEDEEEEDHDGDEDGDDD